MDLEILTEELMFFDLTYELIDREPAKITDEDLYKDKKGDLSKLSRLRNGQKRAFSGKNFQSKLFLSLCPG